MKYTDFHEKMLVATTAFVSIWNTDDELYRLFY